MCCPAGARLLSQCRPIGSGDENHRDVGALFPQARLDFKAREPWHVYVQNNTIRARVGCP